MIVISFNASWKFLWLGTGFFCWLNFGPGVLWVLFKALGIFEGFDFFPIRSSLSLNSGVPEDCLLFVFKAIHGFAQTYLRELELIKRSGNYNLRSSSDGLLLATPTYRSRVTLGDRSFQVAALALWNVLPREICSITDLGIFKGHLKMHLFREAFY